MTDDQALALLDEIFQLEIEIDALFEEMTPVAAKERTLILSQIAVLRLLFERHTSNLGVREQGAFWAEVRRLRHAQALRRHP